MGNVTITDNNYNIEKISNLSNFNNKRKPNSQTLEATFTHLRGNTYADMIALFVSSGDGGLIKVMIQNDVQNMQ